MSYQKVTLTQHQIQRLAVYMCLTNDIKSVTIDEIDIPGIGPSHWAVYHSGRQCHWQEEITDIGNWS